MELAEYLKKKIKHAVKSVIYNRTQYICFFIAMFVVEIFCGLVVIAAHNGNRLEHRYITDEYEHHLELRNLSEDQYYYMYNDIYRVFANQHIYDTHKVEVRRDAISGERLYTMYIRFTGDPQQDYSTFARRYFRDLHDIAGSGSKFAAVTTPLYNIDARLAGNTALNVLAFLLVTALSVALVTALYNIRINHYRFEYGIYMTFGADFWRLLSTCVWEMLIVAVVVYIPAVISSWLIGMAVFKLTGETFEYYAWTPVIVLLFALVVALLSVCMPVWRLSRRTPRANIIAEDNSNLVVSPRISFEMLGKTYPRSYEFISAWRFRKYSLRLYAVASLFTAIFTAMVYAAELIQIRQDYETPQFYIHFIGDESYDGGTEGGYMREELLEIPGVEGVIKVTGNLKTYGTDAAEVRSHILVDGDKLTFGTIFVIYDNERRATNLVNYCPCDPEIIEYLSRYDIEGDPYSVLRDEKTVIVSDSAMNFRKLKLKPGDKIQVAKYKSKIAEPPYLRMLTGHKLLTEQLHLLQFDYVEYTVGAVVGNLPSSYNIDMFFSNQDYTDLTGNDVVYRTIGITVDPSLSPDEVRALETELDRWGDYYDATVSNTFVLTERNLTLAKRVPIFIICIAALLLAVTPLIWFLSQILFTLKREGEFTVLIALGAVMREVGKQCVWDGVMSVAFGSVVLAALTWAANFATYYATNHFIVQFFVGLPLRYIFRIPWGAAALGAAVALVCAYLACYVPYLLFKRRVQLTSVAEPEDI